MPQHQLDTFTDRLEAITLFNYLRGRDPNKPWPLLPILTFIAPGGSGKSSLMEYLRIKKLGGAVPSAHLDFTLASTPKDLLQILITLRDQLQEQDDGQGKHLTFPRFDLGAAIALAAPTQDDLASFVPGQVRSRLTAGKEFFASLTSLGSSLGVVIPYVAPLLAGLQLAGQIRPLQDILNYLEDSSGWKWYRMHGTETGLVANADMKAVLRRLQVLSRPGTPKREFLVEELLPAAFLADILDALIDANPPHAWSLTANVLLFLDGFEALQASSSLTANQLLQALTVKPNKVGQTTPLLLVLGSRDRLPGLDTLTQETTFEQRTGIQDEQAVQAYCRKVYENWQQHLPVERRFLRLTDLYLLMELSDFGHEDIRSYLAKIDEREQSPLFSQDELLVQAIERVTHGHPLYLALAAAAMLEAKARGQTLTPEKFEDANVSPEIRREHEHEHIGDYLLNLFLSQLPKNEQNDLIFCAAARTLDVATLRAILQLPNDVEARERWNRYRQFTFTKAVDAEHIVFHPIVRKLLLRLLPANQDAESDYVRTNTRLRDYFHAAAQAQHADAFQNAKRDHASIEEAYHALALGDAETAIHLGTIAQQKQLSLWNPLLEAVKQAPSMLMPPEAGERAFQALKQGEQHHDVELTVTAIILYTWLLADTQRETQQTAAIQLNLGNAYNNLPGGDRQANLERAIDFYTQALHVYTHEAFPFEWAATQNNLGVAYLNLPGGDRQANLEQAIDFYIQALQVYTHEAFPFEWAGTQSNLGAAYNNLPGGDRQANLEQAIAYFNQALHVYTREAIPFEWAATQVNLGVAYLNLPGGDRQANLEQAIDFYTQALHVYTREAFPIEWTMTQSNLGEAYSVLSGGDRQASLEKAIDCYTQALEVYQSQQMEPEVSRVCNNLAVVQRALYTLREDQSTGS